MSIFAVLWRRSGTFKSLVLCALLLSASGVGAFLIAQPAEPAFVPSQSAGLADSKYVGPAAAQSESEAVSQQDIDKFSVATTAPQPKAVPVSAQPLLPRPANPSIAPAQDSQAHNVIMGKTFQGAMNLHGRQVPLPEGEWTAVAYIAGTAVGATESLVLAQPKDAQLHGLVIIQSGRLAPDRPTGYRQSAQCVRAGLLYSKVLANEDFGYQNCWTINHNISAEWNASSVPNLLKAAVGDLSIRGVAMPAVMISVYYRLADKQSMLHAIYYFNPETEGIKSTPTSVWEESDWHRSYVAQYPEKVAYVQKLRAWSEGWHERVNEAFRTASQ